MVGTIIAAVIAYFIGIIQSALNQVLRDVKAVETERIELEGKVYKLVEINVFEEQGKGEQ